MNPSIREHLKANQNGCTHLLRDLVRIPTVNLPGERYEECATFLHSQLRDLGFDAELIRIPDDLVARVLPECRGHPRFNVVGRWHVGAPRTVHFNAHFDVVPVSGDWSVPPFSGEVKNGSLYGRGSGDMKGAIAALIYAFKAFRNTNNQPAVNVEVSFVCDEEIGGRFGASYLVQEGYVKADYAIVCEGAAGREIGLGHNGVLWLEIMLQGKAAHACRPDEGINAFEQMIALTNRLQKYKASLADRTFTGPNGQKLIATICLGGTFGTNDGAKTNTVPGSAWFTLDRRVLPNESVKEVEAELRHFISCSSAEIPIANASIRSFHAADSYSLAAEHEFARTFGNILSEEFGDTAVPKITPGFTDARFFGIDGSIPTIGYGPGGAHFHGADEHMPLVSLFFSSRVYAAFLERGFC